MDAAYILLPDVTEAYSPEPDEWDISNDPPEICGRALDFPGIDPYSTECHLPPDHQGEVHEGCDPFDPEKTVRWTGGGWCAGDRLPVRTLQWDAERLPALPA